jgi:hypothetical protein
MKRTARALAGAFILAAPHPGIGAAQRLVDWTVRTTAVPEAVSTGAAGVFWNPAAVGALDGRAEAIVLALQTPEALGIQGLAAAGAMRLHRGTTIAIGYQHFGVDDTEFADVNSPPTSGDPGTTIGIGEDRLALAIAQPITPTAWVGAVVQYERADALEVEDGVAFGAGALLRSSVPFRPTIGASATVVEGSTRWNAGVEVTPPGTDSLPVALRASYGLVGASARNTTPSHRLTVRASWRERVSVAVGAAAEPSVDATEWQPAASADLRLGRYLLGIVREPLANDFGAAWAFHLGLRF